MVAQNYIDQFENIFWTLGPEFIIHRLTCRWCLPILHMTPKIRPDHMKTVRERVLLKSHVKLNNIILLEYTTALFHIFVHFYLTKINKNELVTYTTIS